MDWQIGAMIACVVAAAAYVTRATWRTWHPKPGGCGGGCCGKAAETGKPAAYVPADQVRVLRR